MYFKVTEDFIKARSYAFLRDVFPLEDDDKAANKIQLTTLLNDQKANQSTKHLHLLLCAYCRQTGRTWTPIERGDPKYCVFCGRCSPVVSLDKNLQKAESLLELASLSRSVIVEEAQRVLLEQAIVVVVTGLEIMFREAYCLMRDHKHVIFGDTLFPTLYSESRNEFLNMGITNSKFKKELKYNIEESIGKSTYQTIAAVYFKRHVIVHNASNIDIDYISQTGMDKAFLNQRLPLSVEDVRDSIRCARSIAEALRPLLQASVLDLFERRSSLLVDLSKQPRKSRTF